MSERELRALAKTQRENNLPVPKRKRKTKAPLEVTTPDATTERVATEQVAADEDEPTNEETASNSSDETMDSYDRVITKREKRRNS